MRLQRNDDVPGCTTTARSRSGGALRRSLGAGALALLVATPAVACTSPAYGVDVGPDEGGRGHQAHVGGWLDEEEGGDDPRFTLTVDGKEVHAGRAEGERRSSWKPLGTRHERRFDHRFPLAPGVHEICLIAGSGHERGPGHGTRAPRGTKPSEGTTPPQVSAADAPTAAGPGDAARIDDTVGTTPGTTPGADRKWCKTVTVPARPAGEQPGPTTTSPTAPPPTATVPPAAEAPAPPNTGALAPTGPPAPAPAWQAEMLDAVNVARAAAGKPPVAACATLERAAQGYADTMAASGWFDHTGPDGSTLTSRTNASGYAGQALGENIAAGYPDVASVMRGWLDSSGHVANILGDYAHLGAGRTGASWVQNFGSGGTC